MLPTDYRYDEMEGFEELPKRRNYGRRDLVRLTTNYRGASLSYTALQLLGEGARAVRILVNIPRKQVLVYRDDTDAQAVVLSKNGQSNKNRGRLNSIPLVEAIEKMTNRALDVVTLSAPGEPAKTKRNAIIFDFSKCEVVNNLKKQPKGEK